MPAKALKYCLLMQKSQEAIIKFIRIDIWNVLDACIQHCYLKWIGWSQHITCTIIHRDFLISLQTNSCHYYGPRSFIHVIKTALFIVHDSNQDSSVIYQTGKWNSCTKACTDYSNWSNKQAQAWTHLPRKATYLLAYNCISFILNDAWIQVSEDYLEE